VFGRGGEEHTLTFAALAERSKRLATLFRMAGLQPGDALAVFVPMSAPLYIIMAAALRLGLVPVFVEPTAWKDDIAACARHLRLRGFVGTPTACLLRWFVPTLRAIPIAFVSGGAFPGVKVVNDLQRCAPLEAYEQCAPDSTALITFTSGSTGRPKGVLRSHRVLLETQRILAAQLQRHPGELNLAIIPFFVFSNLAAGAGSLLPDANLGKPAAIPLAPLVDQVQRLEPRSVVVSPAFLERLADWCIGAGTELRSVQLAFVGGAPVFPRVLDKLARIAPNASIRSLYGATEAEPIALLRYEELSAAVRSEIRAGKGLPLGAPVAGAAVSILPEPSRHGSPAASPRAAMGQGEILVSGTHVSPGYLGGEGDRENKIHLGGERWHRTGDAGMLDAEGRLWLQGRCSARIEDADGVVYPLSVEAALSFDPELGRAALVSWRGRRVLVLEARSRLQRSALAPLLAEIPWAPVHEVAIVRRIPVDRRHNAKVDYRALVRDLEGNAAIARTSVREIASKTETVFP